MSKLTEQGAVFNEAKGLIVKDSEHWTARALLFRGLNQLQKTGPTQYTYNILYNKLVLYYTHQNDRL